MKNKKIIITLSIIVVLILTIGVTFAVFNYNKVGTKNSSLVVGDIYMHYNETNELTIENAMPFDGTRYIVNKNATEEDINSCVTFLTKNWGDEKTSGINEGENYKNFCNGTGTILNQTLQQGLNNKQFIPYFTENLEIRNIIEKSLYAELSYLEFTIDGKNTTQDKDVYYEINLSHGEQMAGKQTRIKDELLRFALVEYDNGTTKKIFTDYSFSDLENKTIWTDYIARNTTEEIKRTYRLYMWIFDNTKICSGELTENCDYYTNKTPNWSDVFASIKVNASGDFSEKHVNYNVLKNDLVSKIDIAKSNITEINFLKLSEEEINAKYQAATYKSSGVSPSYTGNIKIWLENDTNDTTKYIMNVASNETIYFPRDSSSLFQEYRNVKNINFSNIDTSNVEKMEGMFVVCTQLESIDLSKFDTSKVTSMRSMFAYCTKLASLDLSNFDTRNVINMNFMFQNCSSLDVVYVGSNWSTANTTTTDMFSGAKISEVTKKA